MIYNRVFQYLWMLRDRQFRERLFRYQQELERNEHLPSGQIQQLQWNRLRQVLEHAYVNVPFYRQRFDEAGIHPSSIDTPEDLQHIPILTRQDIQTGVDDLIATNYDRSDLRRNATGGSTGIPMVFYQDYEFQQAYHNAAKLRSRSWAGFEMGDKIAMLWGADQDIPDRSWVERQRVRFIRRERWLNSFNVTPEKMEQFARELIRWRPKYILSYASSAHLFASFLRKRGLDHIRPVAVETSAEKLTDFQRQVIEDVFRCRVFDFYGSREVPSIAAECERHTGLHVFSDVIYLELLSNGRPVAPGEVGEVVITDLTNFGMPFIRYQNGDLARASQGPCPCGRPFPLLLEIFGRTSDVISTPSGQYIHGEFFSHLFYGVDGVRRFQVYQKSLNEVVIRIESTGDLSGSTLETLRQKILAHLGQEVEVILQIVDAIPLTPSGKHRFTISEVPLPFVFHRG